MAQPLPPAEEARPSREVADKAHGSPARLRPEHALVPIGLALSQSTWETYFTTNNASSATNETAKVLYFRYHLVPWMDADAPGSTFGYDLMALAYNTPSILESVLAVSSYHRNLVDQQDKDTSECLEFTQAMLDGDHARADSTSDICRALLALPAYFGCPPSKWLTCHIPQLYSNILVSSSFAPIEPLTTLLRVHLKYGK